MPQPDRRRHFGMLLAGLLALGLIAFAVINLLRWYGGGSWQDGGPALRHIPLSEAPLSVQQAAARLAESRVGYAMPLGEVTYLIISTGSHGEQLVLDGARQMEGSRYVDINLRSVTRGDRLIIAELEMPISDARMVQFNLDGYPAAIPALVNTHGLPLVALPEKGSFAVVSPKAGVRLMGHTVQVSGYARIFEGRFNVAVYSVNKARPLGQATGVAAAVGAPNWGSFRANVPVQIPAHITEGIVLIYDEQTGAKLPIKVRFGSK